MSSTPLVLVYYASEDTRSDTKVLGAVMKSIGEYIELRKWNIFFITIPTSGDDRLECLNPAIMDDTQKEETNKIISDIKRGFDIV